MKAMTFFPAIESEQDLVDIISRAAWFLTPFDIDVIYLPVASQSLTLFKWQVAPGMDQNIQARFDKLKKQVKLLVAAEKKDVEAYISKSNAILVWKTDAIPAFLSDKQVKHWFAEKKVYHVDPVNIRQEGSHYIDAGFSTVADKAELIEACRKKFNNLTASLGKFSTAYLMATGPSIGDYKKFDFSDSISIVCNSVFLEKELMATARPRILVFADPIFHFGPSQYAGDFRERLVESARSNKFIICMPFKYYPLFIAHYPELESRTVGIPFTRQRDWNFDLRADFQVRTTANILTFLMVPLGATFANTVSIIGCDGRPLEDNHYFWGHNKKTQINDKMANIRDVHPGFFDIDYNDYYLNHCETLENQLSSGSELGYNFQSVGFSHIPALYNRYGRGKRVTSCVHLPELRSVIAIDPRGGEASEGTFFFHEHLAGSLLRIGYNFKLLCSSDASGAGSEFKEWFFPAFKPDDNTIDRSASEHHVQGLSAEVIESLPSEVKRGGSALIFMRWASLEHAWSIASIATKYPNIYININLYFLRLSDIGSLQWRKRWLSFFNWLDSAEPRFRVTVPTQELQVELARVFGVILDVSPGLEVDRLLNCFGKKSNAVDDGTSTRVLFQAGDTPDTGIETAVKLAELLGDRAELFVVFRSIGGELPAPEGSLSPRIPRNASVITGTLNDEEYASLLQEGALVVIPFRASSFNKNASEILIDSLFFQCPVVAVEGTWMAEVMREYDFGIIAASDDPDDLNIAVLAAKSAIELETERVADASRRYFKANCWDRLVKDILKPFNVSNAFPRVVVVDLTRMDGFTATGRVKEAFFKGWPRDRFLLASPEPKANYIALSGVEGETIHGCLSMESALDYLSNYSPDVIYYRAVEKGVVCEFAEQLRRGDLAPMVVHIMDDWPERFRKGVSPEHDKACGLLRAAVDGASYCLGISDRMSRVYERRYAKPFMTFANAIDPGAFPPRAREYEDRKVFVFRYTGAIADDMTAQSIFEFAVVIEEISRFLKVEFQLYTRAPWLSVARKKFKDFHSVRVFSQVPARHYYSVIQEADALLVAYNFDEASKRYIGLSMANKIPEFLATGTPVFAYGPADLASIEYLSALHCACVVSSQDPCQLKDRIEWMIASHDERKALGERAREIAFEKHNVWRISNGFREMLNSAAKGKSVARRKGVSLVGPMARSLKAHWDETQCVAELFKEVLTGSTMIDVGAHHGSALMPFLNQGWNIFAFEPDEKNRAKLLDRIGKHKHRDSISVDSRCVSKEAVQGLAFFRSEQSSGISGLSAFHQPHVEAQRVDTVRLSEFFGEDPLPAIDFLKIDTEGHDLFVLQGFPWEKGEPAVIECEFEDKKTVPLGYTFHDLARYIVEKGYTVYVSEWHPIVCYGQQHDWHRLFQYPGELAHPDAWGSLLAFRDPIQEDVLLAAVNYLVKLEKQRGELAAQTVQVQDAVAGGDSHAGLAVSSTSHFTGSLAGGWWFSPDQASRNFLIVAMPLSVRIDHREIGCKVRLKAASECRARLTIGRHGASGWEGSSQSVTLEAGRPVDVDLSHCFRRHHEAVKFQIEVVDSSSAVPCTLKLESLNFYESTSSIQKRFGTDQLGVALANQLFRERDLLSAYGVNQLLFDRLQLQMYQDNMIMIGRKLGIA